MTIKKNILAGAAALALTAGAASAATISVSGSTNSSQLQPDGSNNYIASGLLDGYTFLSYAEFVVNGPAKLKFTEVGAESGFTNTFSFRGDSMTEENGQYNATTTDNWTKWVDGETFSLIVPDGDTLSDMLFSSSEGRSSTPGDYDFGVFFKGDRNNLTTFFLAYDDKSGLNDGTDDNHDDYILRVDVSAVPLPAAGWMLIAGLGGIAAMKRRKKA